MMMNVDLYSTMRKKTYLLRCVLRCSDVKMNVFAADLSRSWAMDREGGRVNGSRSLDLQTQMNSAITDLAARVIILKETVKW